MVQKALWAVVLIAFVGTARCYNTDLAAALSGVPIVGAIISPVEPAPAYIDAIGTPAALDLPEGDIASWFPDEPAAGQQAADIWASVAAYASVGATPAGWAEVCAKAADAAGADRAAKPLPGALACSDSPAVTALQPFVLQLLDTRAHLALWMGAAPGAAVAAVQARQGELRLECAAGVVARQGPETPWPGVCAKALDTAYLAGDAPTTDAALEEAYALAAAELARLDPDIEQEPALPAGGAATPAP